MMRATLLSSKTRMFGMMAITAAVCGSVLLGAEVAQAHPGPSATHSIQAVSAPNTTPPTGNPNNDPWD